MGGFLSLLAALGYTSNTVFNRRGLMEENPGSVWEVNFVVFLTALFIFFIGISIASFWGVNFMEEFKSLTFSAVLLLILDGALGPLIGGLFTTTAVAQIGATQTSALRGGSNPLFATGLAILFLNERPGWLGIITIFIIISGIIIVGYRGHAGTVSLLAKTRIAGGIFALLAGFSYALSHIARGAAINLGATPNTGLFIGMTTALTVITIVCSFKSRRLNFLKHINRKSLYYYFGSGVGALVGRYALLAAFTLIPVWQAVAIRNIQPLLAILLTWIFLKKADKINLRLVTGATLITLGVIILNVFL